VLLSRDSKIKGLHLILSIIRTVLPSLATEIRAFVVPMTDCFLHPTNPDVIGKRSSQDVIPATEQNRTSPSAFRNPILENRANNLDRSWQRVLIIGLLQEYLLLIGLAFTACAIILKAARSDLYLFEIGSRP
jgi:hypothetical protein